MKKYIVGSILYFVFLGLQLISNEILQQMKTFLIFFIFSVKRTTLIHLSAPQGWDYLYLGHIRFKRPGIPKNKSSTGFCPPPIFESMSKFLQKHTLNPREISKIVLWWKCNRFNEKKNYFNVVPGGYLRITKLQQL